ncbi:MAG: histidine--tRNA ligase [Candidatus Saccharibacteria bacterium]|nr:histidine--tRNA ligase [Candidatus Saccharibacteria bacterium]
MKRFNTSPISGMQELLPKDQAVFNQLKSQIEQVYRLHGFQNIETPIIDRTDILLAKAGGDTEKQIYKVVKTAETSADADQALRFDHTVPLARYVVEHQNELTFPFKVSQIGRNFRGERAQKGRLREFYQLDVDVIGHDHLPIAYDADVIFTAHQALSLILKPRFLIRISNRKLLSGLLQELNLVDFADQIFTIIDHAEKVPDTVTRQALNDLDLSNTSITKLLEFVAIRGVSSSVITALSALQVENPTFKTGLDELTAVLDLLKQQGIADQVIADMMIIRGLDYYTGSVFETFLPDYPAFGSICSGGRYENLASNFTEQQLPGVGISIGLSRLFAVLGPEGLLKVTTQPPLDVMLLPLSVQQYSAASQLAIKLRQAQKTVDINYTNKKLDKKLTHAAKIAHYVIVIGEDEVTSQSFKVKDLLTSQTHPLSILL